MLEKEKDSKKVVILLRSSPESWLHVGTDVQPDFQKFPSQGFAVGDSLESRPLDVTPELAAG